MTLTPNSPIQFKLPNTDPPACYPTTGGTARYRQLSGPDLPEPRFTGRKTFPRFRKLTVYHPDIPGTPIYWAKSFPPSIPVNRGPTVFVNCDHYYTYDRAKSLKLKNTVCGKKTSSLNHHSCRYGGGLSRFIFLIGMNNVIHSRRKYFPVQNLTNYVWLSISFPMRPRTVKLDNHKGHSVMFLYGGLGRTYFLPQTVPNLTSLSLTPHTVPEPHLYGGAIPHLTVRSDRVGGGPMAYFGILWYMENPKTICGIYQSIPKLPTTVLPPLSSAHLLPPRPVHNIIAPIPTRLPALPRPEALRVTGNWK
eukprot:sb/3467198/